MNTHAKKTQENESHKVANTTVYKQSGGKATFQFMDNRPETIAQRKLEKIANNSSQAQQANLVKVSQLTKVIQKAPWVNANAKFKSDNGMPDIANSEYLVAAGSYKRYAPINEIRAPGQIFHEGPRSFAYVDSSDKGNDALSSTVKALPVVDDPQSIKLTGTSGEVTAHRSPVNGLEVWDGDVSDDGTVTSRHPGHTVMELGQALPHLENEDDRKLAKYQQSSIHEAQELGKIPDDDKMIDIVYAWIDSNFSHLDEGEVRDNAGLSYLSQHPEMIPALKEAKEEGAFVLATEKIIEWLNAIFEPREV